MAAVLGPLISSWLPELAFQGREGTVTRRDSEAGKDTWAWRPRAWSGESGTDSEPHRGRGQVSQAELAARLLHPLSRAPGCLQHSPGTAVELSPGPTLVSPVPLGLPSRSGPGRAQTHTHGGRSAGTSARGADHWFHPDCG